MENVVKFDLCPTSSEPVSVNNVRSVYVWAEIKDGRLEIAGDNIGWAPKELFGGVPKKEFSGRDQFEYGYKFDTINTKRLIELLSGEDRDVKNLLCSNFSGLDGIQKLESFCRDNDIKYEYWSWYSVF